LGIGLELGLIALGIVLNGFFAASEIALVSARLSRLRAMRAPAGSVAAAIQLKESPDTFLATVQIGITLVGTLASAVGGATAVEALTPVLVELGLGQAAQPVALGVVVLVITYASLVVGELVPKAIALRDPERLAVRVARPILWLSRVSAGLVTVLIASTNAFVRALGIGKIPESPFVSEAEIRYLLREGAAKGIFEKTEEELVRNVFEFADKTVREVMVPRPNIRGIEVSTPPREIPRALARIGHSRVPVYEHDIIHPVGVLFMKDVFRALAEARPIVLAELLRPPLFVPETTKISAVLRQFQQQREQMALVVDEYGTVVGLITIEDIVEEIVGEIRERGEPEGPAPISRLPDGSLVVDGLASIDDIRAAGVPVEPSAEYTTAAGFVMAALGSVPSPGASVTHDGYRWTVLEADGVRVRKIKVTRA
jgi:putative hemolysin